MVACLSVSARSTGGDFSLVGLFWKDVDGFCWIGVA